MVYKLVDSTTGEFEPNPTFSTSFLFDYCQSHNLDPIKMQDTFCDYFSKTRKETIEN